MTKPRHQDRSAAHSAASYTFGTFPPTVVSDPTPLIGRERELEAIRAASLGESVRLLTLTGPAGIGKTRLAIAAARTVEQAFPDGVWFVDLTPLHDPGGIEAAIGQALKLGEASLSAAQQVAAYMKDRHLLLVLDNFEHLLPLAAARVAALLAGAPRVKVLVTSREPLKLHLEHRLVVTGLALPDLGTVDPGLIIQAPAVALFLAHARRIQPELALTPADTRTLAALLHRLEGIPLAIRIAAVHSHVLSPAAMLGRLRGQTLLSTEEWRDAPARHLTLRHAIEWSYDLLGATEQAAFRQLGVFVGGWTLEAAEAIIQDREGARPAWATLSLLVDKSLVQTEAVASGDRRYRLLEPIREYALERLQESSELDAARNRHAEYYLALAEREPTPWGPGEMAWVRRLDAEYEDVRAALRWAAERGGGDVSMRLAAALADYWAWRSYLREGRRWLAEARTLGFDARPKLRARVLLGEGILLTLLGEHQEAQVLLQDALVLAESIGEAALTARILSRLGRLAVVRGDAKAARRLLERSVAESEAADPVVRAFALVKLALAFELVEDRERADAAFAEGLDVARRTGSARLIARRLLDGAQLALRRRDYQQASTRALEALRLGRMVESRRDITYAIVIAALVSAQRGDIERAVRLLWAVDSWSDWTGQIVSLTYQEPAAYAALHARARQQLGESAYNAVMEEAPAMPVDQAADLAEAALEATAPPDSNGKAAGPDRRRLLLSDRERAVLRFIGEGLSNKQIASALRITERTVKYHVGSAMNKLGVDNRAHAAVTAIQRGLL